MSTTHKLRPYQTELAAGIHAAWRDGAKDVLAVSPTGSGKTVLFSHIIESVGGAAVAVAHRKELVSQMSLALAREGVRHRIIGPDTTRRQCAALHIAEVGRDYTQANALVAAAGVDTLANHDPNDPWLKQVRLWVQDEAHHVLKENKWGRSRLMFPNAWGLGVTATPTRADGKGLGRHADGLFDTMIVGPSMRDLIEQGFLTDYRVIAPPSDIDLSHVAITASGEYSPEPLKAARRASHITGDVVKHYLKFAAGKLGVTFDTDVESATETAAAYRAAGVPAEVVSAKTPDALRTAILRRFRNREVLQLVNVDLFGEGFDLPAIEVVSMARPTQSYALYVQQFGRALRLLAGKDWAIIIDHVGNVVRHGLPDARREWTLDRRERRSRSAPADMVLVRSCLNAECMQVYERVLVACPYCGHTPPVANRSAPEFVDGDLVELDPSVLARMRGEIERIDGPVLIPNGVTPIVAGAITKNHRARQAMQAQLREQIALWSGWQAMQGRSDREAMKAFYLRFGVDIATAAAHGENDARGLCARIVSELSAHKVVDARSHVG